MTLAPTISFDTGRIRDAHQRVLADKHPGVWITRFDAHQIDAQIDRITKSLDAGRSMPLLGMTFAIKDNIDFAGVPTTAACEAFAYTPERSATVVDRLIDAGAVALGKTNLDQFATGLVGTRSPYGVCANAFDPKYISGGSSAGSAVSVALGLVDFSLGTDTAGSGRVPAGFNNLVGYKPSRGLLSTLGVVPACRSLDCVSIFAKTTALAQKVGDVAIAFDPSDAFSRRASDLPRLAVGATLRFGVPSQLEFFGDKLAQANFESAVDRVRAAGATITKFDFTPFRDAAALLYAGPWVAERMAAIAPFFAKHADQMLDVTRTIIGGAAKFDAVATFNAIYELAELKRKTLGAWQAFDAMLLPTTPTIYTIDQVNADPIRLNSNLGTYTNFANLLDLAALAVPNGRRGDGLPAGVTFVAPAGSDAFLFDVANQFGFSGGNS